MARLWLALASSFKRPLLEPCLDYLARLRRESEAMMERRLQRGIAETLMEAGVRLADPARLDVRGELQCGSDVEIDVGCVFEGDVSLGDDVTIFAHAPVSIGATPLSIGATPRSGATVASSGEPLSATMMRAPELLATTEGRNCSR